MGSPRRLNRPGHLHAFFVVGEASGDVYGAGLIRALRAEAEALGLSFTCTGWGGDAMAEAGMDVLTHCNDINHMGFWEVFKHFPSILDNFKRAQRDIQTAKPDVVVTIDFPGFNMRLAKRLRKAQHPAFRLQWVAPQVWAWKSGRVHALAQDFDAVAPILPFERDALESAKVNVWNEGHPLLDVVKPTSSEQAPGHKNSTITWKSWWTPPGEALHKGFGRCTTWWWPAPPAAPCPTTNSPPLQAFRCVLDKPKPCSKVPNWRGWPVGPPRSKRPCSTRPMSWCTRPVG